ncbi:MAG: response regulator [Proteobacteria bacterium]|nr:response regulator [Pseudomonadota bacterium]
MHQPDRRSADRSSLGGRSAGATAAWALIAGLATLLIALTWTSAFRVIGAARKANEQHVVAVAAAQADVAAADLDRRLRAVNVLLRLLARRRQSDPAHFNLAGWFRAPLVLPDGASLFLLDRTGKVVQSSLPGTNPPAQDLKAAFAALPRDPAHRMAIAGLTISRAEPGSPASPPAWHIDLMRPLRPPPGGAGSGAPAGALVMVLPVHALLTPALPVALAPHGLVLLVGTQDGQVRAASGAAADLVHLPPGADIAGTQAFAAIQTAPAPDAQGEGTGQLVPGGPVYLYAFHRVGSQPLAVVVAMSRAETLGAPRALAAETRRFALIISGLILLAALAVLGEVTGMRRRERRLARDRGALATANAALGSAKREADAKTAQLEGLLAGLPDGVTMFDSDLRLVAWNEQVAEIAGIPPHLLRAGEDFAAIVRAQAEGGEFGPGDPAAETARRMAEIHSRTAAGRSERPRPDGRYMELRRVRLPDGGLITLFRDITERKRSEDSLREARATAEAATADKSRLIAMVSHELRTPLQALLHGIELLDGAPLDPLYRRLLAGMRQSGGSMLRLAEDILDVARMEAGRLALHAERCDPRRPLERAVDMLRPIAAERGVSLALEVAADVPGAIMADPARLQQIAVNLLSNAAKFSRPGLVRLYAGVAPGPTLLVAVTDQGPPIAPEQRALLFQPFSRLSAPGQTAAGVGLGLSICRDLAALMGGEIGCTAGELAADPAGPASGNVFWFTVPLVGDDAGPTAAPRGVTPAGCLRDAGPRARARARILLAEDVAVSRLVTTALLRREGHAVHPVADGAAAVEAATHGVYDLVLMDMELPGLDGLAATRAIRGLPGAAGAVPIIGLTGSVSPEDYAACLLAGMEEVLAKSAGREELLAAVSRHAGAIRRPAAPADGPAPGEAVLSESRVAELRDNLAPATLARVAEECLAEFATLLDRLRRALEGGDAAGALATAHAMAGLAGGYGLAALERGVRAVQASLRAGRVDEAGAQTAALEPELARAAEGLRQALRIETV